MLLWFAGLSVVLVWSVFRSPALDYRLVVAGSLLPLFDAVLGGPRVLHTLIGAVVMLAAVMLGTQQRRLLRRRIIGVPIGVMVHLVLDGTWTDTDVFWWPFTGWSFGGSGLAELGRPWPVVVVLEAAGAAALWWCWRTFGLDDPDRRRTLVRTGQLPRHLAEDA